MDHHDMPPDEIDERDNLDTSEKAQPTLTAYKSGHQVYYPIVPASRYRLWLEQWATDINVPINRPYHCLPMMMAHQLGWFLLNPYRFACRWDAENQIVHIDFLEPVPEKLGYVTHMFSGPILTFRSLYIFRTSEEYNLLVRGPSNVFKRGIQAMEGLVESNWMNTGFPINWVFTEPNQLVIFEKYEPICMLTPFQPTALQDFETEIAQVVDEPEMLGKVVRTKQIRQRTLNRDDDIHDPERAELRYKGKLHGQLMYMRGYDVDGEKIPNHITRLNLNTFDEAWNPLIDKGHRINQTDESSTTKADDDHEQ